MARCNPPITLKESIEDYLKMNDKIDPIVNEIRNKNKSIKDIPEGYEKYIIKTKVQILNYKDEYLEKKLKLEAAVKDYIEKKLSGQKTSIPKIAEIHGIPSSSLKDELKRRHSLGEKYQYDRKIRTGGMDISYQEEESLLESLKLQFTNTGKQLLPCSCRTCFLLKLSTFAYEYAKSNNITHPSYWTTPKHADIIWLREFEIRHSSEIFSFCSENCTL